MRLEAKFDREKIWRQGKSVRYLVVRVTDPGEPLPAERVPLNLALVIDSSGSMEGSSIAFAIESVARCDSTGPYWTHAPFFSDALRAHPRYPELLQKIGL